VTEECLLGYLRAYTAQRGALPPQISLRDWALASFGDGIARHFFVPYNEKLYRARAEELSLDWVGRYVPQPTLEEVIDGALGLHDRPVGYNATFRYPRRGGIRALPDAVARLVPRLHLGSRVAALHLGERWVETADGRRHPFDRLVSTVALPGLIDAIVDELPGEVAAARSALRWVRVLNVAFGVDGAPPSPEHWLYFPDCELPFYRVGFPSNHGRLAPAGCHTVSVEVSLDPVGALVAEEAVAAERAVAALGLLDPAQVRVRITTVIDPAYVVFDHHRRRARDTLRRFLGDHGVLIAGRWAEWKYSAMEDAILDGMAVARKISEG
jgi:protoporphyrinogen oxidase